MAWLFDHWWVRAICGVALFSSIITVLIGIVAAFGSATDTRIAMTFLINLVLVLGLQTYIGNTGIISFGHVSFMAIGAYGAALFSASPEVKLHAIPHAPSLILNASLGFLPATLIGIVVAVAVALIIGFAMVRLVGAAASVATLGLLVVVFTILSNSEALTRGSKAFSGIPPYTTLGLALGAVVLCLALARLLRDSNIGLGLRSSSEDELAAKASGVDVIRGRLIMWVASAAMAALAGSLYAHYILAILPRAFYFDLTFLSVTMLIVGGRSVSGAVIGAAAITLIAEFLRRAENGFSVGPFSLSDAPGLTTMVLGLLIVLSLTLRPKGLCGRWELDELVIRLAGRYRRVSPKSSAAALFDDQAGADEDRRT
jgi:ABC-type branched-subunit amino acid transport system permease subunit